MRRAAPLLDGELFTHPSHELGPAAHCRQHSTQEQEMPRSHRRNVVAKWFDRRGQFDASRHQFSLCCVYHDPSSGNSVANSSLNKINRQFRMETSGRRSSVSAGESSTQSRTWRMAFYEWELRTDYPRLVRGSPTRRRLMVGSDAG